MKVEGRPSFASTNTSLSGGSTLVRPPLLGQPNPIAVLLFGKRPPRLVDRRRYPSLRKGYRKLSLIRDQVAEVMGVASETFELELCEGENAFISRDGQVAFGVDLLQQHEHDNELLVGVMGHELGHQPWTWPEGDLGALTHAELNRLYQEEEAKADRFAGLALADLGVKPDGVCEYLVRSAGFEPKVPFGYYPSATRAQMIRAAYDARQRRLKDAARWNPAVAARQRELR